MAVEAITYTTVPLINEKNHVIGNAISELCDAISRHDEKLDIIEQYVYQHLSFIGQYENNKITFGELLERIQPLTTIPNEENNPHIERINSVIIIINSLNDNIHHQEIFRELCQNIQDILHPERISLLQQYTYRYL